MQTENNTIQKPVKELTAADIRTIPGYENINEAQADAIADSVKQFCYMVYHLLNKA